ncbi:HHL004Wp [Eremothecium sinecaudum]|uniref:Nucleolar complex-associated protein 3 n=1 Tax=Eremothecium sinecaudum TaxID=45286 RepID=A0A0X8HW15_9SACH|nr:HHL004Wp [Eremothecium sinecaudum]AMD22766.1 HHL004Wp [Eremothecium sinecaudum]
MAVRKRSQKSIQDRTAKRRKEEDALLQNGLFHKDVSEFDIGDEMPSLSSKTWENEEQDYELKPRNMKNDEKDFVEGLPIKVNGKVERKVREVKRPAKPEEDSSSEEEEEDQKDEDSEDVESSHDYHFDTEEKIIEMKELIAELVANITEEPEEHTAALSRLRKMALSKNSNTSKFSILALVTVWKSIIPGYKIRPLSEIEKKEKVSKEVAKLRAFEQNLVLNYKHYVDHIGKLARAANNQSPIEVSLGNVAATAATELAENFPQFNFRSDVLLIIIRRVCKPNPKNDPIFLKAVKVLETLLNDDDEGNVSLEVIRLLSRTLKSRKYNVDESVLNVLLNLDILNDYNPNTATDEPARIKIKKKNRVHLSKKERKARKEMKIIGEEMRKAEQAVSAEERERNQAEILKSLLALYLNILKSNEPRLIGSVLEGLSKFGHMANLDLLGDFLTVMKEMIADANIDQLSSDEVRKILLCIVTAFSLVSSHNHMKVHIDLSSFVNVLYAILPYVALDADIEFSYKTLRLADPLNNELVKPSVNVSTKAELLLKSLDHVFFRSRSGTNQRATAFTKRLYMTMQNTPEKTSIAILKFLDKLMSKYPEIGGMYSTEDVIGNGNFYMEADDPARSNPEAATIWESALLSKHYCPTVVKGVRALITRSKGLK